MKDGGLNYHFLLNLYLYYREIFLIYEFRLHNFLYKSHVSFVIISKTTFFYHKLRNSFSLVPNVMWKAMNSKLKRAKQINIIIFVFVIIKI